MSEALDQSNLREGYKQVQFGPKTLVVPTDWYTERFGNVFNRRRGSIDNLNDERIKYVGLKHIDSGQLKINGYDENGRERSSSRVFHEGDVLFGKLRPNLDKAAIAPFSGICSSDIIPIYAEEDARQQYLPYLMHSKIVRDRAVSTMEGTNLPRTSWSDLEKTLVPLPPLPEQRRIADILSTVDKQIQQTDKIIQKTKELKKGVFNDLISAGVEQNTTTKCVKVGPLQIEIPEKWSIEQLKNVVLDEDGAIRTGPFGSKLKNKHHVPEGVKLYEQKHVYEEKFDIGNRHVTEEWYHSELTSYQARPFDVLITLQGTVGEAAMIPESAEKGVINPKLIRIRPDDSIVDPQYLARFLDDARISNQQIEFLSHGAVVSGLNVQTVGQIKVPLPPLSEQRKIINAVNKIGQKVSEEENKKELLKDLKRGLMQNLLTGKIRVNTD
jgi:type I restriction enzyme S subunit